MITKICTKCGEEKELTEFHKCKGHKYGVNSQCKKCKSGYHKEHYKNNKEHLLEQHAEWRVDNKEHVLEYSKEWCENNKSLKAETNKKWYEINRERIKLSHARYYQENKEKIDGAIKKWRKSNPEVASEIAKKHNNKHQRELGFIPLNKKFPGSVAHHIDKVNILYVPENLHKSIPHSQGDRVSMNKINELIFEWYKQGVV